MSIFNFIKGFAARFVPRAAILLALTILAFVIMEPLTIMTDTPEVMKVLQVVAILSWLRFSVWTLRLVLMPRVDMQKVALEAGAVERHGNSVVFGMLMLEAIVGMWLAVQLYLA